MAEERELILKLGKKITDRIPYKLGMEKLTVNDPEYWGLAGVVTDEMAEVALCMDVRKPITLPKLAKKKEISTGVEKKFKLKKYVPCDQCHGTGAEGDGGSETCPTCKGSGSVIRNQQTILGTMQTRVTCSTCGGEGKIIKNKCKKCGGDGIVYGEEVVSVNIPAGVAEGMQLSMGGKGNAGKHNGVAGDLLILVEEEPHQDLIRDENDLIYNLLLSFPTAALGGAVEIPTIDGKVKVKIDSGTQPGKVLRLRGKGLPNVNGYGTGDLLVNISIYVPEALNKEEKNTLEKMEASDNFKPNTSVKEKIFKKFKSFFD